MRKHETTTPAASRRVSLGRIIAYKYSASDEATSKTVSAIYEAVQERLRTPGTAADFQIGPLQVLHIRLPERTPIVGPRNPWVVLADGSVTGLFESQDEALNAAKRAIEPSPGTMSQQDRVRVRAARLQSKIGRKLGKPTPADIEELAAKEL